MSGDKPGASGGGGSIPPEQNTVCIGYSEFDSRTRGWVEHTARMIMAIPNPRHAIIAAHLRMLVNTVIAELSNER